LKAFAGKYFAYYLRIQSEPVLNSRSNLVIGYLWHSWTALSTANTDSSTLGKLKKLSLSATPSLTKSIRLQTQAEHPEEEFGNW